MPTAKIVTLQVDARHEVALDRLLRDARNAFEAEAGTVHWNVYDSRGVGQRTLVEIFADAEAVQRHDDSAAAATLLAGFHALDVEVVAVDELTPALAQIDSPHTEREL